MEPEPRRRSSGGPGPGPGPKRRRILESARAVFAEQGFDAARMDEVARRARVSKGTVYNHFDSKESLLVECVLASMAETRERIDALARSSGSPDRALASALRTQILDLLPSIVGGSQSLAYQVWSLVARDRGVRERLFSYYREFYRAGEARLCEGLDAGAGAGVFRADLESEDLAMVLLAIFDGLVYRAMFDPERIDAQRVLDTLLRLLEGGLRRASGALADGEGRDDA
jgi:AcrR family transcriptional regulator